MILISEDRLIELADKGKWSDLMDVIIKSQKPDSPIKVEMTNQVLENIYKRLKKETLKNTGIAIGRRAFLGVLGAGSFAAAHTLNNYLDSSTGVKHTETTESNNIELALCMIATALIAAKVPDMIPEFSQEPEKRQRLKQALNTILQEAKAGKSL